MNMLPLTPHQLYSPPSPSLSPSSSSSSSLDVDMCGREEAKLRVLVQPNDVQVKRVGRASCIEPDVKLCVEMDTPFPKTITINAYLKVLGKDNKHKLILLRKSDDITFTKTHKREIIGMKLRFLKTIKVQVLKRNLGVSRPEASIVFEAVNSNNNNNKENENENEKEKENEGKGKGTTCSTSHFAIISDPRYLDEVKHRRASERGGGGSGGGAHGGEPYMSDDEYQPVRRFKRRRIDKSLKILAMGGEEPASPSYHQHHQHHHGLTLPKIEDTHYDDMVISPASTPCSPFSTSSSSSSSSPFLASPLTPPSSFSFPTSDALQTLKECADYELNTSGEDDERSLMKLVEALKHKGCNFDILPPRSSFQRAD